MFGKLSAYFKRKRTFERMIMKSWMNEKKTAEENEWMKTAILAHQSALDLYKRICEQQHDLISKHLTK